MGRDHLSFAMREGLVHNSRVRFAQPSRIIRFSEGLLVGYLPAPPKAVTLA